MGATVRNTTACKDRLKMIEEREKMARAVMGKMSIEQLSDVVSFHKKMGQICDEVLERRMNLVYESTQVIFE
ncbi:hypothetical protein RJ641_012209 [Dillenia turbinata]|uniref:Uncharacterized protein n=1 Tax=Dillenia turbinata TaxID=194707 RepID=A0AAN8V6F5_9MAGN